MFRDLGATQTAPYHLGNVGLPEACGLVPKSGNVPYLLDADELAEAFSIAEILLTSGGSLIVRTTTVVRGGPEGQDRALEDCGLSPVHRYADWYLEPFEPETPWSVGIHLAGGPSRPHSTADGKFVLRE